MALCRTEVTTYKFFFNRFYFSIYLFYRGLDYSRPWHDDFVDSREGIRENLHILHPAMMKVLNMCQTTLGNMILVDCSPFR